MKGACRPQVVGSNSRRVNPDTFMSDQETRCLCYSATPCTWQNRPTLRAVATLRTLFRLSLCGGFFGGEVCHLCLGTCSLLLGIQLHRAGVNTCPAFRNTRPSGEKVVAALARDRNAEHFPYPLSHGSAFGISKEGMPSCCYTRSLLAAWSVEDA
eukprot:Gb_06189 [translate_table: standard]